MTGTFDRRNFLRTAAVVVAAVPLGLPRTALARSVYSSGPRIEKGSVMSETTSAAAPLTIVLVHGAFADTSSWSGVIERLQAAGVQVTAPANPLRGIAVDSGYLASVFEQIPGPVLAVGHSYAGALISNAATNATNVVGLVFVAAFAPDDGERLGDLAERLQGQPTRAGAGAAPLSDGRGRPDGGRIRGGARQVPRSFRRRPPRQPGGRAGRHPASGVGARLFRAQRRACLETSAELGRGGDRRQGRGHRHYPFHGPARPGDDHRARRLPCHHDLTAPGGHGRHSECRRRGQSEHGREPPFGGLSRA